jgi:hypothetical protein
LTQGTECVIFHPLKLNNFIGSESWQYQKGKFQRLDPGNGKPKPCGWKFPRWSNAVIAVTGFYAIGSVRNADSIGVNKYLSRKNWLKPATVRREKDG